SPILYQPPLPPGTPRRRMTVQDHRLDRALDRRILIDAAPALDRGEAVQLAYDIRNEHRSVGAMLAGEVVRRYGGAGLPDAAIGVPLRGPAGQSFGAFLPPGVTLRLSGDANDYVGKGLSGGRLVIRPDERAPFVAGAGAGPSGAEEQIIAGNTI